MTAPAFKMRGVMLDPGRITARKEYYALLLPWLAEWGYNLLHLHLIDDQRCALRFPSHPELATPGAFTAEEMRELVELAARLGISVMPEIETLGHARRIFSHKKHRVLKEPPPGKEIESPFNSLCPAHPGTRELISDLLRDVVDIFDYPVIHAGLDEVQMGRCPRCRKKFGARASDPKRYAVHAAWVHQEIRKLGRRPAMWSDHIVHHVAGTGGTEGRPEIAAKFGRDVLMFNWDYHSKYMQEAAGGLLAAGFEVVACPALVRSGTLFAPYAENLANIRTCASRSLPQRSKGVVGLVNTVWCPWRFLPGAIDYGLALGGHLFSAEEESSDFSESFAARFYGLKNGKAVGRALENLCDSGLSREFTRRLMLGKDRWGNAFGREDRRQCELIAEKMTSVLAALKKVRGGVRRHHGRYDDLIISAGAVRAVARYGAAGRDKRAVKGAGALYRRAEKAWGRDRQPGDPMRFAAGVWRPMQSVLYVLKSFC